MRNITCTAFVNRPRFYVATMHHPTLCTCAKGITLQWHGRLSVVIFYGVTKNALSINGNACKLWTSIALRQSVAIKCLGPRTIKVENVGVRLLPEQHTKYKHPLL